MILYTHTVIGVMCYMLLKVIVCLIAGIGAGLGTGFAGMSAAVVISPMLITFLGVPAYQAVGIALASDVLAVPSVATTTKRTVAYSLAV